MEDFPGRRLEPARGVYPLHKTVLRQLALFQSHTRACAKAAIVDFDHNDLMPGNATVRVSHSTVNDKDGLAIAGKDPVVRVSAMIGGIDFAGAVETSDDSDDKPGDAVVCNGWACRRRISALMPRRRASRASDRHG